MDGLVIDKLIHSWQIRPLQQDHGARKTKCLSIDLPSPSPLPHIHRATP